MMRYAISQEGADAMLKLASDLRVLVVDIESASSNLKSAISVNMDELGTFGIDIWALTLEIDNLLNDKQDVIMELAEKANRKSDEILALMSDVIASASSSSTSSSGTNSSILSIDDINTWITDINPRYNDPFIPPDSSPFHDNCGSSALAVEHRMNGDSDAVAQSSKIENINTDGKMEKATGKECKYMSPDDIKQKLISMGPGSHLICGINRHPLPDGRGQAGHWFNAYYDGNKVYTVDGQCGRVFDDWPHDYGDVSEWCALV